MIACLFPGSDHIGSDHTGPVYREALTSQFNDSFPENACVRIELNRHLQFWKMGDQRFVQSEHGSRNPGITLRRRITLQKYTVVIASRELVQSFESAVARLVLSDPSDRLRVKSQSPCQRVDGNRGFAWSNEHDKYDQGFYS